MKSKSLKKLLLSTVLILSVGTAQATLISPHSVGQEAQIIGGNYHADLNAFDPGIRCIEVDKDRDVEMVYNEKAVVSTTSAVDYETLKLEVGHGSSLGAAFPTGDPISMSYNFLKTSEETDTSIVFSYRTTVQTGHILLKGPHKLTKEALELSQMDPEAFQEYCGDAFVYKIEKGANAYVSVKIDVETKEAKRLIEAEFGVTIVDFVELATQMKNLRKKYGLNGKVSISAFQEGGFAARINSIFGSGEGMAQCNGTTFANCEILLKEVVYYFAHSFPEQFDHYYRSIFNGVVDLPPSAKTLSYSAQSYCKLARQDRPSNVDCSKVDNSANILSLNKVADKYLKEREVVYNVNDGEITLAPDYQKMLDLYKGQIDSNLYKLQLAKKECRRDQWSCEIIVRETLKHMYALRPSLIDALQKEERIEICFYSGNTVEFSNMSLKLYEGSHLLKTIKVYEAPKYSNMECFRYHSPELTNAKIDGLEIQIQTLSEENGKCKIRTEKKYSSWADWNLKRIEVTQLATSTRVTFAGAHIKQKSRCKREEDAMFYLNWKKLDLLK